MKLVADLGNTSIKIGVFDNQNLTEVKRYSGVKELNNLAYDLKNFSKSIPCIISSVVESKHAVTQFLKDSFKCLELNHNTPIPIQNQYKTPESLGLDRLCNAVGANHLLPKSNVLTIDFGTCIKFDLVTKTNEYLGGAISPGLNMRFKALHNNTAQLPLLSVKENPKLIGGNTTESIQSGVMKGIEAEIIGIANEYKQQFDDLQIILTGGDHLYFVKAFKNNIFANPNLTLEGLHSILNFNEPN